MTQIDLARFDMAAFDLEGTLADTIPAHHAARQQAFAELGFGHITKEQHALGQTYGSVPVDIIGGVLLAAGEISGELPFRDDPTVRAIVDLKTQLFNEIAAQGFDAIPGGPDFVRRFAAAFAGPLALVTTTSETVAHPFLERFDLTGFFAEELVICEETLIAEGLETKPAADPYCLAKERAHSVRPVVFEDTVSGTASGKKADGFVIAMAFNQANAQKFAEGNLEYPPDVVFESYDQAAEALGLAA